MAEVKETETQEEKKPTRKRTAKKATVETVEKVEAAEQAVEVVTESDTQEAKAAPEAAAPADGVTESDTQEQEPAPEPVERFCYMGPTLRKYGLIENMIYTGTASQLAALTEPAKAAYPEIDKMIFPAKDFQRVKLEKAHGNNYIGRLYKKIKQM